MPRPFHTLTRLVPTGLLATGLLLVGQTPLAAAADEQPSVAAAREQAATERQLALDRKEEQRLIKMAELLGADSARAREFVGRVREHEVASKGKFEMPQVRWERFEDYLAPVSPEAARKMKEGIQQLELELARQRTSWEPPRNKVACSSCDRNLSWCLNFVDNLFDECLAEVGRPLWCLDLWRDLFMNCFSNQSSCYATCTY